MNNEHHCNCFLKCKENNRYLRQSKIIVELDLNKNFESVVIGFKVSDRFRISEKVGFRRIWIRNLSHP